MKSFIFAVATFFIVVLLGCGNRKNDVENENQTKQKQEGTNIKTSTVTYMSGSDSVKGYLAMPEGDGPFPALIVIHEWWGFDDWIKSNTNAFAEDGFAALAVDLYRGKLAKDPGEAHELMRGLPEDRAMRDMKAAYNYIQTLPKVDKQNIGSIGWCMGGGYSLQAALNLPELSACVICYGRLVTDEESIKNINPPILGIFGEQDRGITPDDVKNFQQALNKAGKENKIIIYPGVGHAFMNQNNKQGYDSTTTEKAWEEIYNFLDKYLQ